MAKCRPSRGCCGDKKSVTKTTSRDSSSDDSSSSSSDDEDDHKGMNWFYAKNSKNYYKKTNF